jgi:hypothetical protein
VPRTTERNELGRRSDERKLEQSLVLRWADRSVRSQPSDLVVAEGRHPELLGRPCLHRARNDIHDDLDLSLHLDPSIPVLYEATLRVGISARPFSTWTGMVRHVQWAWRTFLLHWPEQSPRQRRDIRRQLVVPSDPDESTKTVA